MTAAAASSPAIQSSAPCMAACWGICGKGLAFASESVDQYISGSVFRKFPLLLEWGGFLEMDFGPPVREFFYLQSESFHIFAHAMGV